VNDLASPFPTATAGTLPGAFSVSGTGEAGYTLNLVSPPGRAGMEPHLGLAYSSGGGDGVLGMGFSITGLSTITRCPANLAADGYIRGVRDDGEDKYCLDGKRLVPIHTGSKSVEYRTFPDTFARIIGHLGPGRAGLAGPVSFDVHAASGLRLVYGTTPDSRVRGRGGATRAWWVAQATDRLGNFISYAYENALADGHALDPAPAEIRYTGFEGVPAAAPARAVVFHYDTKDAGDIRTLFRGGVAIQSSRRLASVEMLGPGAAPVRSYDFTYTQGPGTGRTVLASVQECAADHRCTPPTRFGYEGRKPGFQATKTALPVPFATKASPMLLDVTGDGLDDLVIPDTVDPSDPATQAEIGAGGYVDTYWNLAVNRGKGGPHRFGHALPATTTSVVLPSDPSSDPEQPPPQAPQGDAALIAPEVGTALDYDQDGRMDVFFHDVHGTYGTWNVLLAQPDHTFKRHDTGIARPLPFGPDSPGISQPNGSVHLADVDGDGVPDLIQCENETPQSPGLNDFNWALHRWTPAAAGWEVAGAAIDRLYNYPCNTELYTVDVNGDGKVDLVVKSANRFNDGSLVYLSSYDALTRDEDGTWPDVETEAGAALPTSVNGRLLFLDVNGDGLPDAVMPDQAHQLLTYLNTGRGFAAPVSSLAALVVAGADAFLNLASPIDYDGDGRQDLLVPLPLDGTSSAPSWRVLRAKGGADGATFAIVDPQIPFQISIDATSKLTLADPRGPRVTDLDGDGAQDVLIAQDGFYSVFRSVASDQDLLTSVIDGMNDHDPGDPGFEPNVRIDYGHMVDRSITDGVAPSSAAAEKYSYVSQLDDNDLCVYPRHCAVGPRRIVTSYTLNNGANRMRPFSVRYRDGRFHRLGRGFLGFGSRVVVDEATQGAREEVFDTRTHDADLDVYPNAGQVVAERAWSPALASQPDTVHIELSFTDVALTTVKTYGGRTYFTLPTQRRVRREQGVHLGGATTTAEQYAHQIEAQGGATMLIDATTQVGDYDTFGNVRAEVSWAAGVDLVNNVTRTYANDTTKWLIGRLKTEDTCSAAAGLTQCRTMTLHYDVHGQLYATQLGSGDGGDDTKLGVSFKRDVYGNVIHTAAVDGFGNLRASCTSYEPEGIFPFARKNAAGHLTFTRFDPGLGVLTALVDPNQLTSQWAHDGFGRVTEALGPDQSATTYAITRKKSDRWRVRRDTVTAGGADETVEYDSLARPVRRLWHGPRIPQKKCAEEGCPTVYPERLAERIVFDDLGEHVARRSLPASEGTPESALLDHRYQYDALGRLVVHTSPWNADTYYDHVGTTVEIQDSVGALSYVHVDGVGRTTSVVDEAGSVTSYGYGPFGLALTITAPDHTVTTTHHDAWGRIKQLDDPDRGTTISTHDGFGDLTWSKDALGRESSFKYDALGRTLSRVDLDGAGTHTTTWAWDTAPLGTIPGAQARGELAAITSPDGADSYAYDNLGRVQTSTLTVGGESFTTAIGYGLDSRVDRITYPTPAGAYPFVVLHGYDDHGHLVGVSNLSTGTPYWRFTSVDDAGRVQGETFGNGVVTTRDYFGDKERVKGIFTTNGSEEIQNLAYDYDVKLNLVSRRDALQSQHKTERFGYDALDRLRCAYFSEAAQPSPTCAVSYAYDAIGNLTLKSDVGPTPYVYDLAHQHPHAVVGAGGDTFGYDAVGNQIARSGTAVAYTPFDLPKTVTPSQGAAVTLDYDGAQRRIRKSVAGGDVTVYAGALYERVAHPDGSTEHRYYVHAAERMVAIVTLEGNAERTLYAHVDNLGSIDVLTNEDGSVAERRSYEAFGARRNATWGSTAAPAVTETTRGFTGHEGDEDLGLVNMKGRIYDPKVGRFLTPDPIVAHPGSGQSWNPYSYVLNNPLKYTDPSGFTEEAQPIPVVNLPPVYITGDLGREPSPEPPPPTIAVAGDTSAAKAPNDVGTTGNTSEPAPQVGAWSVLIGVASFTRALVEPSLKQRLKHLADPLKVFDPFALSVDAAERALEVARGVWTTGSALAKGDTKLAAVEAGTRLPVASKLLELARVTNEGNENWTAGNRDPELIGRTLGTAVEKTAELITDVVAVAGVVGAAAAGARTVDPRSLRPTHLVDSQRRVNKIADRIKTDGFDPTQPIETVEIDGELYIKDGHHRTAAAVRVGVKSVPVTVRAPATLAETAQILQDFSETFR
jgi:RHS repeat-associated protein